MKFFKLFEIDPSQRKLERILARILKEELGIQNWKIKFIELDIRDPKDISEEIWGDVEKKIIDLNEAREVRGLEPRDEDPQPAFPPQFAKPQPADGLEKILVNLEKFQENLEKDLEGF